MTSGADLATAVGTIATAVLAGAGLIVSLVINARDRDRANEQAKEDRDRADKRAEKDRAEAASVARTDRSSALSIAIADRENAALIAHVERQLARQDAERRHIVDLLLELGRSIAALGGISLSSPAGQEAVQHARLLLWSLPGECAYATRQRVGLTDKHIHIPGAVGEKMSHLDLATVGGDATPQQMFQEIAYDIDRYMTSGKPPAEVWSDVDELREWQRTRWPRQ